MNNLIDVCSIKTIYYLLMDDISRKIFENRFMYSLTDDSQYIRNVVSTIDVGQKIVNRIVSTKKEIGIFGAGAIGKYIINTYKDLGKIRCFIDNKVEGEVYNGIPVISLNDFKKMYPDGMVVISTKIFYEEILEQLKNNDFLEEDIINLGKEYELLNHKQYFDLPELKYTNGEEEVFVDGGAYDGSSTVEFMNWCKKGNKKGFSYVWEPDKANQEKCKDMLDKKIDYEIIEKGLWNQFGEISFSMDGSTSSAVSETGTEKIIVDSIDGICNKPISFIKMDVEGSEYNALLGSKNVIEKYKPKLAICIYHKKEDIWEIPLLIHKINPEYRFYMRHYSLADNETVLYAI